MSTLEGAYQNQKSIVFFHAYFQFILRLINEYYRLEKDFEGSIELEPTEEGFKPITGEAGRREKKKDSLTIIIDKINEKYGTTFTEMDNVLLQIENDYAA